MKHVNVHAENQRLIEHIEGLEQNKLESQKIISEKPEMQAKISDLTKKQSSHGKRGFKPERRNF